MGQIRIFNRPPKAFEFDKEDLVIDNVNGDIYYKNDKNQIQKIIKANDSNNSLFLNNLVVSTDISSSAITASSALISNITASGNISASGTIIANNFESDGQQQIAVADSFNITGSITASGDVSASGTASFTGGVDCIGNAPATGAFGYISASGDIITTGNISSSGGESTFGQIVNLVGTDPRLKLKAIGANHPGLELYEDGTRKWVVYNDPDERNNLTFKNNSTELVKISQVGDITASADMNISGEIIANTGSFNIIEGGVF